MDNFKIKIYSRGGQRVKSTVESLKDFPDFFLTTLVKYDGVIKGGMVETDIVLSKKKRVNPFVEEADLCIFFTDVKNPIKCKNSVEVSSVEEIDLVKKVNEILKSH